MKRERENSPEKPQTYPVPDSVISAIALALGEEEETVRTDMDERWGSLESSFKKDQLIVVLRVIKKAYPKEKVRTSVSKYPRDSIITYINDVRFFPPATCVEVDPDTITGSLSAKIKKAKK
jgi:hypothetical protein